MTAARILDDWCDSVLAQSWYSNRAHRRMLLETDGMRLDEGLAHEAYRGGGVGPDAAGRIAGRFAVEGRTM